MWGTAVQALCMLLHSLFVPMCIDLVNLEGLVLWYLPTPLSLIIFLPEGLKECVMSHFSELQSGKKLEVAE